MDYSVRKVNFDKITHELIKNECLYDCIDSISKADLLAQLAMCNKHPDELIIIMPGCNRGIDRSPMEYKMALELAREYRSVEKKDIDEITLRIPNASTFIGKYTILPADVQIKAYTEKIGKTLDWQGKQAKVKQVRIDEQFIYVYLELPRGSKKVPLTGLNSNETLIVDFEREEH